jgi:hypothetical protein
MAWKGRVAGKRADQASGTFALAIDFYDDANPAVIIVRRDVVVPSSASLPEIQILVRAAGVVERAKFVDLAALDSRIAVGAEVTI